MRRFTLVLVMMVVVLLGVTAPGGQPTVRAQDATSASGATARTDVRYLLPFGPDGLNPGLTVSATVEGVCGFSSIVALDRPDAWDCISTHKENFHPCFEPPMPMPEELGQLAFLQAPLTTEVTLLTL